ncbi:hypothetical protein NI389_19680 (plasmid) [Pseudoalteromonas xiamenensis]|uniref:hypothetical protein n=1 Tax=Pseudoalteromonas xiamenensis TaxID=882626 RepID=UPI0027E4E6CD|nr:hypothetical protein [Pseudoalteromonas xiamenensis]WMN62022.1 hypothetical protein NI389_19680 [Pseudoalteromonas xiamenensis]
MDGFYEALERAIETARLAPSSHNCQPWRVDYSLLSQEVCVGFDSHRVLRGLDSLEREMFISAGVFTHFLTALLACQGYQLNWQWQGEQEGRRVLATSAITKLSKGADVDEYHALSQRIRERHTIRSAFKPEAVDIDSLETIVQHASCHFFSADHVGTNLGNLTKQYAALDFTNKSAWEETYNYIRFDEDEFAEDGFYLRNLFGPVSKPFRLLFRYGFHPTMMPINKRLGLAKKMAVGLGELVESGPYYLALSPKENSQEALFECGYELGVLWLHMQKQGIGLHPISVLVQHETARKALAQSLQCPPPAFFARLGHIDQSGVDAPRRSVESILNCV